MKRKVLFSIALLTLALFTFACATTSKPPALEGVITTVERNSISVAPANGEPTTFKLGWTTDVFFSNGVRASGTSVLVAGQSVRVWTNGDTAATIVIQ